MDRTAEHFIETFQKLVSGDSFDLYEAGVSSDFENIAGWIFAADRPYQWYDGANDLAANRRKKNQIEYSGQMWVGDVGNTNQWKEKFFARVTDKRSTKQGVWVYMEIGDFRAENDLTTMESYHFAKVGSRAENKLNKRLDDNPNGVSA